MLHCTYCIKSIILQDNPQPLALGGHPRLCRVSLELMAWVLSGMPVGVCLAVCSICTRCLHDQGDADRAGILNSSYEAVPFSFCPSTSALTVPTHRLYRVPGMLISLFRTCTVVFFPVPRSTSMVNPSGEGVDAPGGYVWFCPVPRT
jgi:hypothetical protein